MGSDQLELATPPGHFSLGASTATDAWILVRSDSTVAGLTITITAQARSSESDVIRPRLRLPIQPTHNSYVYIEPMSASHTKERAPTGLRS